MTTNEQIDKLIKYYDDLIADGEEHQTTNFNWATAERIEMARNFISDLYSLYQYETSTSSIG